MSMSIQEFIRSKNYNFNPEKLDGQFHEIKTDSGKVWYKGKSFTTTSGKPYTDFKFGNYKEGITHVYPFDESSFTKKEQKEIQARLEEERIQEEAKRLELQEEIATRAAKEVESFAPDDGETSYAKAKGIGSIRGAFIRHNPLGEKCLVIPMKDHLGRVWNYQTITPSDKTFVDGGRMHGLFFQLGQIHGKGIIYLSEGVATGVSIFMAKKSAKNPPEPDQNVKISPENQKFPSKNDENPPIVENFVENVENSPQFAVISCFNGGNLCAVAQILRQEYPDARIVICADNDGGLGTFSGNPGLRYAHRAAHRGRATICIPKFSKSDKGLSDFNDLHVAEGLDRVATQIEAHKALGPEQIIPTEYNGFHEAVVLGNGHIKMEPQPIHLAQWLDRERPFRIQAESEQIYVWTGRKYVDTSKAEIRSIAQDKFWVNLEPNATNHMRNEFLGAVMAQNVTPLEWFNHSTKNFINFKNGVLDTRSMTLLPHSPERGFRTILSYDYDPTATCENFDQMMSNISQGNTDLETLLLEYMGYVLSGDRPWLQKALVCVGEGANGKSTWFNILKALTGTENVSSVNAASFDNDQRMFLLDGKLLNISEETGDKALFKTSEEFKNLVTGGDIVAKKLYSQPYEFKNRAKLILSYNTFPRASDTSHGLVRRLLFANFNAIFDKSVGNLDRDIEKRAMRELCGIFNKAWGAYQKVKERGEFSQVQMSEDTLRQFQYESDNVLQFWEEHCSIVNGEWKAGGEMPRWCQVDAGTQRPFAIVDELYQEYHEWCKSSGMMPLNLVHFSRRVIKICRTSTICGAPRDTRRTRIDGRKRRVLDGVTRCV